MLWRLASDDRSDARNVLSLTRKTACFLHGMKAFLHLQTTCTAVEHNASRERIHPCESAHSRTQEVDGPAYTLNTGMCESRMIE